MHADRDVHHPYRDIRPLEVADDIFTMNDKLHLSWKKVKHFLMIHLQLPFTF